jgi:DNA-binding transcriptional LysR family regulator
MRNLNLDQVRTLVAVHESGNLTKAAALLHLSQPAVTKQINELEARFNVSLIAKVGRNTALTQAGLELVELGRQLLDETERVAAAMRRHSEGWLGRVRIGMSITMLTHFVPPILRQIHDEHPTIDLVIKTGLSADVTTRVFTNQLDLGLVTLPVNDTSLTITPYFHDQLMVILPPSYGHAPPAITPSYLAAQPLILGNQDSALRRMVTVWLAAANLPPPRPVMELDNIDGMKSLVGAGLGISVIPSLSLSADAPPHMHHTQLMVRPLTPPVVRAIGLIERSDRPADRAFTYVRSALLNARKPAERDVC